jgi:ParB-like chromosome segregation protein Spo0J
MKYHEAANIFPLMDEDELRTLAEDIGLRGQLVPIEICDGMIIDGRNRWAACEFAGIEPLTVEVNPKDPVAYVLSLNLHRRHLDETQRAMVGGRAKGVYEKQAKERQSLSEGRGVKGPVNCPDLKGDARDKAGEAAGVSGKSVDRAAKVLASGSKELIAACDRGEVAVSAAAKIADLPKARQNEIISKAKDEGKPVGKEVAKAAKNIVPQSADDWTESEKERRAAVERGETVVANKKTDRQLIRWASEKGHFLPIDRGTQWGNPFVVGEDGDRDTVCESFEVYFNLKLSLQVKIPSLAGKVLGCWCFPERCHGNHLVEQLVEQEVQIDQ